MALISLHEHVMAYENTDQKINCTELLVISIYLTANKCGNLIHLSFVLKLYKWL
jgi:hypothetical protein